MTVLVQTPMGKTLIIEGRTLDSIKEAVCLQLGVPLEVQKYHMGGRIVPEDISDMCTITLFFGCEGGKGGFGSLLRNQAQTRRKITNWDHSRDRDGRRIGNVKNESSLIEFFKKRRDEESKISSEVEQVKAMQSQIKQAEVDIKLDQNYRNRIAFAEKLIDTSMKLSQQKKAEKIKQKQDKKDLLANLDLAIQDLQ